MRPEWWACDTSSIQGLQYGFDRLLFLLVIVQDGLVEAAGKQAICVQRNAAVVVALLIVERPRHFSDYRDKLRLRGQTYTLLPSHLDGLHQ